MGVAAVHNHISDMQSSSTVMFSSPPALLLSFHTLYLNQQMYTWMHYTVATFTHTHTYILHTCIHSCMHTTGLSTSCSAKYCVKAAVGKGKMQDSVNTGPRVLSQPWHRPSYLCLPSYNPENEARTLWPNAPTFSPRQTQTNSSVILSADKNRDPDKNIHVQRIEDLNCPCSAVVKQCYLMGWHSQMIWGLICSTKAPSYHQGKFLSGWIQKYPAIFEAFLLSPLHQHHT